VKPVIKVPQWISSALEAWLPMGALNEIIKREGLSGDKSNNSLYIPITQNPFLNHRSLISASIFMLN